MKLFQKGEPVRSLLGLLALASALIAFAPPIASAQISVPAGAEALPPERLGDGVIRQQIVRPVPDFGPEQLATTMGLSRTELAAKAGLSETQLEQFVHGAQIVGGMTPADIALVVAGGPADVAKVPTSTDVVVGDAVSEAALDCYSGYEPSQGESELECGVADTYKSQRSNVEYQVYYACGEGGIYCDRFFDILSQNTDLTAYANNGAGESLSHHPTSTYKGGTNCDWSKEQQYSRNVLGKKQAKSRTEVEFCYDQINVTRATMMVSSCEPGNLASIAWDCIERITVNNGSCYQANPSGSTCSGRQQHRDFKFEACIVFKGIGCWRRKLHKHRHYLHANGTSWTEYDRSYGTRN